MSKQLKPVPFIITLILIVMAGVSSASAQTSDDTQTCLECHKMINPGIVLDWKSSRHSQTTPTEALAKPDLQKRVSSPSIPESLKEVSVGCY